MRACNTDKIGYLNNRDPPTDLSTLPRCSAIAARTGKRCKRAALESKDLCGIHAGRYRPGSRVYNRPSLTHDLYTETAMQERKQARDALRCLHDLVGALRQEIRDCKESQEIAVA